MCSCSRMCTCVYMCMRTEINIKYPPLTFSTLFFEIICHWTWSSQIHQDWLAREPWGISLSAPQHWRDSCHHIQFLGWALEIWTSFPIKQKSKWEKLGGRRVHNVSEEQKGVRIAGTEWARARKAADGSRTGAKCSAVVLGSRLSQAL